MKISKLINFTKFLYQNPPHRWSFGKGRYVKHVDSMNKWINKYSSDRGIYVSNRSKTEYPEVTGYLIETLTKWGYSNKAEKWFEWLVSIQNEDGGWPDQTLNNTSVFFDSAQIIRGIKFYSDLKKIPTKDIQERYLKYFSKNYQSHLIPKTSKIEDISWHLINLQAAWIVHQNWPKRISLDWLTKNLNKYFSLWNVGYQISHFDIYILEAMYELGIFPEKLQQYLHYFDKKVKKFKYVPCDRNNNAPCYTATAQLGVLYYKMGRKKDGDELLFSMLNHLDTRRGNWPGSGKGGNYIKDEVSWGLKYFLDLLFYYQSSLFDLEEGQDWDSITDKFHREICNIVSASTKKGSKVLDVGCGLGRYMHDLKNKFHMFGVDISRQNVRHCRDKELQVIKSSLTNIVLPKNYPKKFDLIYAIESFEHAVFPKNALFELTKILEDKGKILIIDKDLYKYFHFRLCPLERYYSKRDFNNLAKENNLLVKSYSKVGNFIACEMIKDL